MAYDFVSASSQYLELGLAPVSAAPLTMACLTYDGVYSGGGSIQTLMALGSTTTPGGFQLRLDSVAHRPEARTVNSSDVGASSVHANTLPTDYRFVAAVFASASSRQAINTTTPGPVDTTTITPPTLNRLHIGARVNGGAVGNFYDDGIAEAAIWNVALTTDELTALSQRFSPTMIRPANLVFYAPLIRGLQDLKGGTSLTATGATVDVHPRVRQR